MKLQNATYIQVHLMLYNKYKIFYISVEQI